MKTMWIWALLVLSAATLTLTGAVGCSDSDDKPHPRDIRVTLTTSEPARAQVQYQKGTPMQAKPTLNLYPPTPTQTTTEVAQKWCAIYDSIRKTVSREAYQSHDTKLTLFLFELSASYAKEIKAYCGMTADTLRPGEFLLKIDPYVRMGVSEDAELGHNARVCMRYYDDLQLILLGAMVRVAKGEEWMSWLRAQLVGIEFGGEIRNGFHTGGHSQFCPAILDRYRQEVDEAPRDDGK